MLGSFFLLGLIILIGFAGNILFNKTQVPEALFLILIGIIIGPVLHIVDPVDLNGMSAFIANLALIVILLDSGLSINIYRIIKKSSALAFTLMVFASSTLLIAAFLYEFTAWNIWHALLLGVICSGTTTVTVMSIIGRLNIPDNTKSLLFMESTINDITLIAGAVVILNIMKADASGFFGVTNSIVASFSTALVLGAFTALLWSKILSKYLEKHPLNYVSTLGVLFILYDAVELLGGSGAIAALVFSITLGNLHHAVKKLKIDTEIVTESSVETLKKIRTIQLGITFFVKTFFFVFFGIIFSFTNLTQQTITISLAMLALMLASRYLSLKAVSFYDRSYLKDSLLITLMLPRGFVATVVAFLPLKEGIVVPQLNEIVLLIVFLTTTVAVFGATITNKKTPEKK